MNILRIVLGIYAFISLVGGIYLLLSYSWFFLPGYYLLINALVIIGGLFWEMRVGRYKGNDSMHDDFVKTKEKFIDHSTGKLMEVFYNPKTGERVYKEISSEKDNL